MSARSIVEADGDGPPLGAQDPEDAPREVTVRVRGEGAAALRGFLERVAAVCNSGASRAVAIEDPADERERECRWSFDGDGNTRIEVVPAGGREGGR